MTNKLKLRLKEKGKKETPTERANRNKTNFETLLTAIRKEKEIAKAREKRLKKKD